MLQNARVTAFNVSELLRENQQEEGNPTPTQIRVKGIFIHLKLFLSFLSYKSQLKTINIFGIDSL